MVPRDSAWFHHPYVRPAISRSYRGPHGRVQLDQIFRSSTPPCAANGFVVETTTPRSLSQRHKTILSAASSIDLPSEPQPDSKELAWNEAVQDKPSDSNKGLSTQPQGESKEPVQNEAVLKEPDLIIFPADVESSSDSPEPVSQSELYNTLGVSDRPDCQNATNPVIGLVSSAIDPDPELSTSTDTPLTLLDTTDSLAFPTLQPLQRSSDSAIEVIDSDMLSQGSGRSRRSQRQDNVDQLACDSIALGQLHKMLKSNNLEFSKMYQTHPRSRTWIKFDFDHRLEMRMTFAHYTGDKYEIYCLSTFLSDLVGSVRTEDDYGLTALVFQSTIPPRISMLRSKSKLGSDDASDSQWMRCSGLFEPERGYLRDASQVQIHLYRSDAVFEVGRCNAFRVLLKRDEQHSLAYAAISKKIENLNIKVANAQGTVAVNDLPPNLYKDLWTSYYSRSTTFKFETAYLLDSAVSTGCITESHMGTVISLLRSSRLKEFINEVLRQIVFSGESLTDPRYDIPRLLLRASQKPAEVERIPEYCVKLRKVVITATSMRILPASIEVSNRILRQYTGHIDFFLRIQFLDEIGHGRLQGRADNEKLFERIFHTLAEGVQAGGRRYTFLAFGNSQLREHGAFFFSTCKGSSDCGIEGCKGLSARSIREAIGDVSRIKIVAKQAARVGQAFSSTRALKRKEHESTLIRIADFEGGVEGKFCFSDGVGMITEDLLKEVTRQTSDHIGRTPTAMQFRLGGAKGVLSLVCPSGITFPNGMKIQVRERQIFLRPSQRKFESDHDSLELVRLAKYGSAFLNRQFITTLWSLGVETEIFLAMQRAAIEELDMSMVDEKVALKCLSKYVDEHRSNIFLSELVAFGFMARGDPFVNQVLRLFRDWSLKLLKEKAKVSIEKGCYLMGVVDETGCLQGHLDAMYSQDESDIDKLQLPEIFIQIADPEDPSRLKVIEEVCLVCRAPSLHPGDIRMVRAVNKPQLAYLHDVVVFPKSGDQDLASMCSGGDLDGDDYTIIWDRRLFPPKGHRYERCMSYIGPPPKVVPKITIQDVLDFMVTFMKNDSLGQIAHAHLAFAHDPRATLGTATDHPDCRAFSKECMDLAELHSIAVDFPKTGIPARMPKALLRDSYPDFMEKKSKPSYISDTPLSHMYRQIKSSVSTYELQVNYDNTLCNVPDMIDWLDRVKSLKQDYDRQLKRLMNEYGIGSEAEVVTGFILSYNDKFSSKREFEVRVDVAQKYGILRDRFRKEIDIMAGTIITTSSFSAASAKGEEGHGKGGEEVTVLDSRTTERRKEAIVAAMYDVTFTDLVSTTNDTNTNTKTNTVHSFLSFPWIYHEVLGRLSREREERDREGTGPEGEGDGMNELSRDLRDLSVA